MTKEVPSCCVRDKSPMLGDGIGPIDDEHSAGGLNQNAYCVAASAAESERYDAE